MLSSEIDCNAVFSVVLLGLQLQTMPNVHAVLRMEWCTCVSFDTSSSSSSSSSRQQQQAAARSSRQDMFLCFPMLAQVPATPWQHPQ